MDMYIEVYSYIASQLVCVVITTYMHSYTVTIDIVNTKVQPFLQSKNVTS